MSRKPDHAFRVARGCISDVVTPQLDLAVLLLVVLMMLCSRDTFAAFAPVCQPHPYKGSVKMIVFEDGAVDPPTAARPAKVRRTINVSPDGRLVTEQVPTDIGREVREYDADGRLLNEIRTLDGITPYTETRCDYDSQGRLARATMKSQNPDFNRTFTYTYTASTRSEKYVNRATSFLTTVTLDPEGRPIREVEVRSAPRQQTITDFRYVDNATERCWTQGGSERQCVLTRYDAQGNAIEVRSVISASLTEFEYDKAGNWVKRTIRSGGSLTSVVWRRITYWDQ